MVRFTLAVAVVLVGCSASGGASLERASSPTPDAGAPSDEVEAVGSAGAPHTDRGGSTSESSAGAAGAPSRPSAGEGGGGSPVAGAGTAGVAPEQGGSPSTSGTAGAAGGRAGAPPVGGGPSSDGTSDDCLRPGWDFDCPAPPVDYPICHCVVRATTCWGTSPTTSEIGHCWAYSITKQGVAIHGQPEGAAVRAERRHDQLRRGGRCAGEGV
jgi:hypothetical protein